MHRVRWFVFPAALLASACSESPSAVQTAALPPVRFASAPCAATGASAGAREGSSWEPKPLDGAAFLASVPRARVVRASDLGVRPNTGVDASPALQAAIDETRSRHAEVLVIPAGVYLIDREIRLVSGVAVVGEGCGRTVLRRMEGSAAQIMFRVEDLAGVRVQGIEFDLNHAPEYYRPIGFRGRGSRDVVVVENCFVDSRPNTVGEDRFAVELSAQTSPSNRVWIGRNRASGWMQLTAGGGAGVDVLRIVDNEVVDAEQNAIAVTDGTTGATFRDVRIARNRIVDAHGIGVYVGPDKVVSNRGTYTDISIVDNVVTGLVHRFAHAIYLRAASRRDERVTISGNVVSAGIAQKANGIRLEDTFGGGLNTFTDVLVTRNEVHDFSRGIWLAAVDGGLVSANQVTASIPLIVSPDSRDVCLAP